MLTFRVIAKDGEARSGVIETPHGTIHTPAFVTVGTLASVKTLSPRDLRDLGTQVIIANTYHLHLQPGEDIIAGAGGLHKFMGWSGPLMTDSGGFQIFSHGAGKEHGVGKIASIFPEEPDRGGHLRQKTGKSLVTVNEEGVDFVSYLDGSRHRFTPETVIQIQAKLGADIILPLDECTSPLHDRGYTRVAMERTHQWALRALEAFHRYGGPHQSLFGIVQGGAFEDLRKESAAFIQEHGFSGFAIGGSLGRSKHDMHNVLEWTVPHLPEERPRHLLGIGEVEDIFEAVKRGVDTFDCVAPTRMARTGTLLVSGYPRHRMHILNSRFRTDYGPIEEDCPCYTCSNFSRAYLRHLFAAKKPSAMMLATIHNLSFIERLMGEIRSAIAQGSFQDLMDMWTCQET
ncbi:MAG: tRNA guanosine(34) transglycosylase Tgt [Deltaproteobacteria bacterium]|nr:MAG: tRNA guanosine(34) transglycosylase Tgt [Deltaproteobacteria bacterium]